MKERVTYYLRSSKYVYYFYCRLVSLTSDQLHKVLLVYVE